MSKLFIFKDWFLGPSSESKENIRYQSFYGCDTHTAFTILWILTFIIFALALSTIERFIVVQRFFYIKNSISQVLWVFAIHLCFTQLFFVMFLVGLKIPKSIFVILCSPMSPNLMWNCQYIKSRLLLLVRLWISVFYRISGQSTEEYFDSRIWESLYQRICYLCEC